MRREEFFIFSHYGRNYNKETACPIENFTDCPYANAARKGLSNQQSRVFNGFRPHCSYMVAPSGAILKVQLQG